MSNLSKREKVLLILMFIAVLGYLYYKYAATPLLAGYNKEKAVFDNSSKILSSLKNSNNNISNIKKQSDELNNQILDFTSTIPNSSKVPEIIMYIKDMTDSSGCTAIRMYFGDIKDNNPGKQNGQINKNTNVQNSGGALNVVPIGYEVNGDFNSIMALLAKLENCSRKMIIDKLSITRDEKTGLLSASININCYFLNKGEAFTPTEYPFINSSTGKDNIFN